MVEKITYIESGQFNPYKETRIFAECMRDIPLKKCKI